MENEKEEMKVHIPVFLVKGILMIFQNKGSM